MVTLDVHPQNRRRLIKGAALGLAAGLVYGSPRAQVGDRWSPDDLRVTRGAFDHAHELVPLTFDASKLNGLSARLINSHWSNNYGGSVRALNEIKRRLASALNDAQFPAFVYNDLKREHLMRTGSVVLHELYFENLGGDGQPGTDVSALIDSAFGGFARWETEFRRIAAGLGGGSGWVVLGYNRQFQALENYWMADHMHSPAATVPLLVMDMYEHSYQMDYGAATARYVDAFFANIDWNRIVARVKAINPVICS
jgi:Fe-Mn family superoxide dismutase